MYIGLMRAMVPANLRREGKRRDKKVSDDRGRVAQAEGNNVVTLLV
jgi:hypothetical protein